MKKFNLCKYEILCIFIIYILGIMLHFTYEWSHENSLVGLFSAVNESTWEHLKLLFFPSLILSIIGMFLYKKEYPNYICVKTISIILSMIFLIIFYYTYKGILGFDVPLLNILSFFLSVLTEEFYFLSNINKIYCYKKFCILILLIITISFFIFTYYPPHIGLFFSEVDGIYGVRE